MRERGRPVDRRITMGVGGLTLIALIAMGISYGVGHPAACFDVAWTASAAAALVGMLVARCRAHPENRLHWTLWSLAAGAWLFGQLAWDLFGIIGMPNSPNVADVGWWLFALLVMASMLRLPRGPRSVQLVAAIESIPLVFAAVALSVAVLWPTFAQSHLPLAGRISALVYPALYVSATIVMLQAMLAGTLRGVRTPALGLVLGGMAAQALGFILWCRQLLHGTYAPGTSPLDPLWVLGLIAIAAGGLLSARNPEAVGRLEQPTTLGVILPGVIFLAMFATLTTSVFITEPKPELVILRLGMLCSAAALIGRSSLLGRRLKSMLHRERGALAVLAEREAELARLNQQLTEDSRRDPLTGIGNRRALSDDLPMLETRQREHGELIAVALCDVDHFKAYNDRMGHLAGDQALRMIAATVRGALRAEDTAYRFGGEELLLVLRGLDPAAAVHVAERVRLAVQRAGFEHPDGECGVLTVSIGVACGKEEVGHLLARADSALYDAKRTGRNRVVAARSGDRALHKRPREAAAGTPVARHLRSMLAVSRAAAAGQGAQPVMEVLARAIRSELSFHVVCINLHDRDLERLQVVAVVGDQDARATLLGATSPLAEWQSLLTSGENVHGASWLPAGSFDYNELEGPVWTPMLAPSPAADAWHPDDMLLLPLRGSDGALLGVVSVDEPLLGRRPSHDEIGVLMAVADHAGLALEQIEREAAVTEDGSAELRLAAVMLMAETLDLRDPGTALHSRTVGQLSRMTAVALGLPEFRVERIHAAGVLHDLGKLGIADAILQKAEPLSESEWREMHRHPELGASILEHAGMRDIAGWVRAHHERLDGCGYPLGLGSDQIPLESRILAVADAYEAMVADRTYRAAMPEEEARAELVSCSGTQFDPDVVAAFLSALDDESAVAELRALEPIA